MIEAGGSRALGGDSLPGKPPVFFHSCRPPSPPLRKPPFYGRTHWNSVFLEAEGPGVVSPYLPARFAPFWLQKRLQDGRSGDVWGGVAVVPLAGARLRAAAGRNSEARGAGTPWAPDP
jgi:hypothetical protein